MTNLTHHSFPSGVTPRPRYWTRLLTLLLLLVAVTTQAKADDFYTYTYDSTEEFYKVSLSSAFKDEVNKASGGEFTGEPADGTTVTWKTGDPLPAFDADYSDDNGAHPLSLNSLFAYCSNTTSLDLSNYNTENVVNMYGMFYYCTNLEKVDLSSFDTRKVTSMVGMFNLCRKLTKLDLSNFDTGEVTSMLVMFYECNSLTSLDLSNFNTEKVTTMERMFQYCNSLTSVDLSHFNTENVTSMAYMFSGCSALTSLDLSSFTLNEDVQLSYMFSNTCSNNQGEAYQGLAATTAIANKLNSNARTGIQIDKLKFQSVNGDSSNEASFQDGFYSYTYDATNEVYKVALLPEFKEQLNKADGGTFTGTTSYGNTVTWKTGDPLPPFDADCDDGINGTHPLSLEELFANCDAMTSLDLSDYNTANVSIMNSMFAYCSNLSSINLSSFNTANVTDMASMFLNCNSLSSLDLSNFNTTNVTDMSSLFYGCSSLSTLDLSNWNTANVQSMAYMFYDCSGLVNINLTGLFTIKIININYMFAGCTNLTSLDLSTLQMVSRVTSTNATLFQNTCANSDHLVFGLAASNVIADRLNDSQYTGINTAKLWFRTFKDDFYTYSYNASENLYYVSLTSGFKDQLNKADGGTFTGTTAAGDTITWQTGDPLPAFNANYRVSLDNLFNNCSLMTSLNLSNYNTERVASMQAMFSGCSSLSSLDVSNFSTANVTNMASMFANCSGLSSLDVSKFNTASVTSMASMFSGCSGLSTLNLSTFNTANVTSMQAMFSGCSGLGSVDLTGFNTANVTKMNSMFADCSVLTSLDLSDFTLKDGVKMASMFGNTCANSDHTVYGLAATEAIVNTLNNSGTTGINTDKLKFRTLNFYTYTYDASANVYKVALSSGFKDQLNKATGGELTGLTVDGNTITWKTGDPMPAFNSNYDDGTNGQHALSLEGLFAGCSAMTSIDLSEYNTANVTNMASMFSE